MKLLGFCPMGCGETLSVIEGRDSNSITCTNRGCPNPAAAARILEESETEHVVEVGDDTFSLKHPLRERLEGELFDCPCHKWLRGQEGPPVDPGRYRLIDEGDPAAGYYFEPIET